MGCFGQWNTGTIWPKAWTMLAWLSSLSSTSATVVRTWSGRRGMGDMQNRTKLPQWSPAWPPTDPQSHEQTAEIITYSVQQQPRSANPKWPTDPWVRYTLIIVCHWESVVCCYPALFEIPNWYRSVVFKIELSSFNVTIGTLENPSLSNLLDKISFCCDEMYED